MSSYVDCRACQGLGQKIVYHPIHGHKSYPCKVCNSSGINSSVYRTNCNRCYGEIIYPRDINTPNYCKTCRSIIRAEHEAKWKTTSCKKCHTTIKYNVDWNKIPDICKDCISKEKAKWKTKPCTKCGISIRYNTDWDKVPDLCKSCLESEKAKWKTKYCKHCGSIIKYNIDWNKTSDLCRKCIDSEKSKWKIKSCEACGQDIKYNTDWTQPPKYCRDCANVLRALKNKEDINKTKALEVFHTQPQRYQTGDKKSGDYITVKSGYNRIFGKICSDFIIRNRSLPGEHYHIVIDIDGNILQDGYRLDH